MAAVVVASLPLLHHRHSVAIPTPAPAPRVGRVGAVRTRALTELAEASQALPPSPDLSWQIAAGAIGTGTQLVLLLMFL